MTVVLLVGLILKKMFLMNIVNDENLQVIGKKQTKD